jgi:hypothetical protein
MPLRYYNQDSLAERQDSRGSPEENVLDLGYAFSRSNLTGGEGLDWYPRQAGETRRELDQIRFWDSSDLIITRPDAGRPYTVELASETAAFYTPAAAPVDMGASKDRVYLIAGDTVYRFDDFDNATPDDTDDLNVTLVQIAVGVDNTVAVLDANGDIWLKGAQTETYLLIYDSSADGPMLAAKAIWLVKGRVIAYCNDASTASDGIMLEIAPVITGTPATPTEGAHVFTTVDTFACVMNDCVDAGHAIVAAFSDGSVRSYVPQADAAGDAPLLTIRARATMPGGENPFSLGWNSGQLLILTLDSDHDHARLYSGQVLDVRFDYVIGGLQLLRTWEESGETAPAYTKNMVSTRDEVLFWIAEATSENNQWRYDLVTQGLFRDRRDERGTPLGSVSFDDSLAFLEGNDLVTTTALHKTSGYLITPNITFGLNTPINWTAFVLEAISLEGGAEVALYRASDPEAILDPDHAAWILVTTLADVINSGVEQTKINVTSNTQALMVVLTASADAATSPSVTRFAMRGLPKHRDWIAEVPVNISDMVSAPGRAPMRIPELGDQTLGLLLSKEGASTVLTVLDPPITLRGIVDKIVIPTATVGTRGSQGRVAVLVFRGSRVIGAGGGGAVETGITGLGIGLLGVATLGIDT